jgi:conjugative relaxase-like TrwC/TraI family protein
VLSLHTGYDTAYLTDAVGGSDYYTGAAGEPPGYWQGAGAAALGLAGQVDAAVMRALYHEDVRPDGQVLARRQRPGNYPAAAGSLHQRIEAEVAGQIASAGGIITPEEIREIRLRLRAQWRNRVPFYDYTFSAPKSVSVLWASLLAASAEAEAGGRQADAERLAEQAGQIRGAVRRANDRMIALAERRAAYVRTGHHSATSGQWRDASGFIVASFQQHTNREGDPQLHVHNAVGNRAQRADGADQKWRALHGQPLFRMKLGFGTYGDRFLAQELEELGWRTVRRADGNTFEVGGISEEAADAYSYRARELRDRYRELEAQYTADHGHAPGKQARWALKQRAALETRDAKEHDPPAPGQELDAWARKAERRGAGKLAALHEQAAAYSAEHGPGELPSEAERARAIRVAVAEVQRQNAVWNRSQLTFELGRALPPLPPDADPEAYLDELAAEALSGRAVGVTVLQIAPVPDVVDVSRLGFRKDGTSIYRPPDEALFVTSEHLDHEQHLVDVAVMPARRRISEAQAEAALAGTDLDYSQRQAVKGLLTSGRFISCLVAPAGTGKTHAMAVFARIWAEQAGGRVIGLTASENAARQLAGEGLTAAVNIAKFLGKIKDSGGTRGHMPVYPGDVLVVDEATQVSTEDMLRIEAAARQGGATIVGTGDTEQLGPVDAGGVFRLIAARHGSWKLTEVRRFRHAWERDASLKLREGDITALAEYSARGRVYHGPRDRVYDDAVSLWVTDHRAGRDTLLLAASNEEAAELARLARERLVERGQVSGAREITLADGNAAGRGDLVRARLNTRIDADGQTLSNRDTIRIDSWQDGAFGRLAVVSRRTGQGQWSRQFFVPAAYLEQNGELDYAGNVHVAQGRTVDTGHLVVSEGVSREKLYVGLSRGREKNTMHVVTGAPDPAQPARAEREAYGRAAILKAHELRQAGQAEAADAVPLRMPDRPSGRQMAPWEAVVAQAMQRSDPEGTALEAMQAAQDFATHTGHLLELVEASWRLDVVPKIDEMVRQRITPAEYERYMRDPERPAFLQVLREHEIGGRRIEDVLDSITAEPLEGARSIAAILHGRAGKEPAPARGMTTGWAERAPRDATAEIETGARMMDARQAVLGERLAARPPRWAVDAWGMPPAEPGALRDDWQRRAGLVESYREAAGVTDPRQAIGPVPAGKAHLAEAFRASVHALELPDEAALLKAMNRGQLEAQVQDYVRAEAIAPPDVQAEVGDREHLAEEARLRADEAVAAGDVAAAETAEAEAAQHAAGLARLAVADAARREWREATAAREAAAREAAAELRRRGVEERIPVTDAEVAEASAQPRDYPAPDPAEAARQDAEQAARIEADRQARAEAMARQIPVTDAELAKYGAGPDAAAGAGAQPEQDIEAWWDAHLAGMRAEMGAEARDLALRYPVTDAEIEAEAPAAAPDAGPVPEPGAEGPDRHVPRPQPEAPEPAVEPGEPAWRREVIEPQPEIEWRSQYRERHPELFGQPPGQPEPRERAEPVTAEQAAGVGGPGPQPEPVPEPAPGRGPETGEVHVPERAMGPAARAVADDAAAAADGPESGQEPEAAEPAPAARPEPDAAPAPREPEPGPERDRVAEDIAELRAGVDRIRELVDAMPAAEDERQAQRDEIAREPGIRHEAQAGAEAHLEASWDPGETGTYSEPAASAAAGDFEAELEI